MYDVNYFIEKFEAIPEEKWCVGDFVVGDKCCAFGHCGVTKGTLDSPESIALSRIVKDTRRFIMLNDGDHQLYRQPTPKQRVLAALRDIQFQWKISNESD